MTKGSELTLREKQVLHYASHGYRRDAIADQLFLSPHTIAFHVGNIFTKLGAKTITEAVAIAIREGLIEGGLNESSLHSESDR